MSSAAPLLLLAYYVLAFLLEEDLLQALRVGGWQKLRRESRLLSREFCICYYPVIVLLECLAAVSWK